MKSIVSGFDRVLCTHRLRASPERRPIGPESKSLDGLFVKVVLL